MYSLHQVLFSLLSNEIAQKKLNKECVEAATPEVLHKVYNLAVQHNIAHLIGDVVIRNNLLPETSPLYQQLKKQMLGAAIRSTQLDDWLDRVGQVLDELQVPYIPLKGSVLRGFYPQAWMRTSCDIDILVHEEDLDRCVLALSDKLGFTSSGKNSHDVSLFWNEQIHLELHYTTVEEGRAVNASSILSNIWNYAYLQSESRYMLRDEMFYFYHIAHMAKHIENGGCGVRPFLDLYILNHNMEYDQEKRDELLKLGGLTKFECVAQNLSEYWLSDAKPDDVSAELEAYILKGGSYGSVDNHLAVQSTRKGSKRKYISSRLFMPYDTLKCRYPVLIRNKWLYPIMLVCRWFSVLSPERRKRTSKELRITTSQETLDTTSQLLSHLGL